MAAATAPRLAERVRRLSSSADLAALPPLLGVVLLVFFGASEGGFDTTTWMPGTLVAAGLLAAAGVALPIPRPSRPAVLAAALLFAYAAWSWLSVAWADARSVAIEGADRALLYAILFSLFALWPLRTRSAVAVIGALALGIAGVALVELLRAGAASDPLRFFFRGRLDEPVGYANANVALWAMALWPCVVLASRRELPAALRGLFMGAGSVLVGAALLGQSRGWLFALPAMAVLLVLLTPSRGRVVVAAAGLAIATLAMAGPVLDVYDVSGPGVDLGPPLRTATRLILIVSVVLGVLTAAVAIADRRAEVSPRFGRRASAATVTVAVVLCVVGAVAGAAVAGDPAGRLSRAWGEFKEGGSSARDSAGPRLTSDLATNRYDFWRVAWNNFQRHPIAGIGADNFQQDYLARGRSSESARYPHSLPLRILSQTGLIGALLLIGAAAAALVAATRALRSGEGTRAAATAAALLMFLYWVVHGSVDWLYEFPALGGAAFAMLGLAVALGAPAQARGAARRPGPRALAGALGACLVAILLVAPPWIAELEVKRAVTGWRGSIGPTFDRLDRARALNPASPRADLARGAIAVSIERLDVADKAFTSALERDPRNSFGLLMSGAVASERGDDRRAQLLLERAVTAAPNSEVAQEARRTTARGGRVDASGVTATLVARTRERLVSEPE